MTQLIREFNSAVISLLLRFSLAFYFIRLAFSASYFFGTRIISVTYSVLRDMRDVASEKGIYKENIVG